jgi:hypothetical protein
VLAELALLREENARLKAARHRSAGLDRVMDHTRSLVPAGRASDVDDDATQLAVDTVVLRESLLDACAEIKAAMDAIEAKLRPKDSAEKPDAKKTTVRKNGSARRVEPARNGARRTA